MKRTGKLGLLAAVLVLLIAGTAIVAGLGGETTVETEDTSVTVFSLDGAESVTLSWTYEDEELTFAWDGESWSYPADSAFPVNEDPLNVMLAVLSEVTATKTIESIEDLSEYGLLDPACTITVDTGEETTLTLGDETEMGGYRYLSLGNGNVYLVSDTILEDFSYALLDLAERESIPAMDDISTFTLETDGHTWTFAYLEDSGLAYSDSYVWFLREEEGYTTLDTELTEAFIGNITGLSWLSCVDYQAGGNLEQYGLEAPAAEITIVYTVSTQQETGETDEDGDAVYETVETEERFVLELGDTCEDGCYARMSGSDMVYLVDSAVLDTMLYTTVSELLPDEVLLLSEDALLSVDVTLDGTTYSILRELREVETEAEDSTEEATVTEETVYTLDGEDIGFDAVLEELEYLSASGAAAGAEAGQDEIAFVFHMDSEDYPELTLTFHQYNSTDCLVTLNGETRLLVSRESVVALAEAFRVLVLES